VLHRPKVNVRTCLQARGISTSFAAQAQALTEVPVEGDVETLLKEIDRIVSAETASAKDVADAAVSLAYLQAKGNRRCVHGSGLVSHQLWGACRQG
jgi:hypothetical protein